jgi:hypothetical protein
MECHICLCVLFPKPFLERNDRIGYLEAIVTVVKWISLFEPWQTTALYMKLTSVVLKFDDKWSTMAAKLQKKNLYLHSKLKCSLCIFSQQIK